jgi:hypothetical protein
MSGRQFPTHVDGHCSLPGTAGRIRPRPGSTAGSEALRALLATVAVRTIATWCEVEPRRIYQWRDGAVSPTPMQRARLARWIPIAGWEEES